MYYNIPRVLYEAYMTDEESFVPYVPLSSMSDTESEEEEEEVEETEDTEDTEDTETEGEDTEGFSLHQGEILETYYYTNLTETTWEDNYEDIDISGTVKLSEIIDLDRMYKGVRSKLRTSIDTVDSNPVDQTHDEVIASLDDSLLGFITEETFNEGGMELSISGMPKLMEKEYFFNFTQMLRSKIIEEVIKTGGLKPMVDPTGLNDEVIDYTNVSTSGSGGDDEVYDGDVPADVKELAKKICSGKSGCKAKIQAIWNWEKANIDYEYYCNSPSNNWDPSKCLANRSHLNCCDTACLTVHLLRAVGVKANYVYNSAHCWCVAYCGSAKTYMDKTSDQRSLGEVWNGMTGTEGEHAYGSNG